MKEKLNEALEKVKALSAKLGKKVKIVLAAVLCLAVVGAVAAVIVVNNRPYTVLFTGLNDSDISSILTYLDASGVTDYQVQNSDTILVPENQEATLKAKVLMEGYPRSGFGYQSYFDNVGALSTESERNFLYLTALQDQLDAVIRELEGVRDAHVTISQQEDTGFILDPGSIASAKASVMVVMEGGAALSTKQVTAIRNLISRGVKGLEIENVAIADSQGNTYNTVGGDEAGSGDTSQLKLQLEEQTNNAVRSEVLLVLVPMFGEENVKVGVRSTVDIRKSVLNSTTFTEPDWATDGSTGGEGIIGSKIYDNRVIKGGDTVGGVVGTQSNSDVNNYVEDYQPDGTETDLSSSGQIDYNVNTDQEYVERTAGVVSDIMISVSINSTTAGDVNVAQMTNHVARVAGIDVNTQADRISILTMPFYEQTQIDMPGTVPILPDWAVYAAIGGAALFLLLLVLILVIRAKRKKRKAAKEAAQMEGVASAQPIAGADIMNIQTEKSMELRQEIRQFAEESPQIAAQMIRSWLKGGDGATNGKG